jgi:hypothetical protein
MANVDASLAEITLNKIDIVMEHTDSILEVAIAALPDCSDVVADAVSKSTEESKEDIFSYALEAFNKSEEN